VFVYSEIPKIERLCGLPYMTYNRGIDFYVDPEKIKWEYVKSYCPIAIQEEPK